MDEGAFVAHLVAVVGGGEDGNALAVVLNLVPLLLTLVTPVCVCVCVCVCVVCVLCACMCVCVCVCVCAHMRRYEVNYR